MESTARAVASAANGAALPSASHVDPHPGRWRTHAERLCGYRGSKAANPWRVSGSHLDKPRAGKCGPKLQKTAHRVRRSALLEILLGGVTPLLQPRAQRMDWAHTRTGPRFTVQLIDRIDQSMRVACSGEAAGDSRELVGQIGESRLGHAGSGKKEERAQP